MLARALSVMCASAALVAAAEPGTCVPTESDAIVSPSIVQTVQKKQRLLHSEDLEQDLEQQDLLLDSEEDFAQLDDDAIYARASEVKAWSDQAGGCSSCPQGCIVQGGCYQQTPDGKKASEPLCLQYNGTWCNQTAGSSCSSCPGGCSIFGGCHYQTPWGTSATDAVCRKYGGKWCGGAKLTCSSGTCKGCIVGGKCYLKTPQGQNATEQLCMYYGGEWCAPKVTCASCNDGCIVYGKCYTQKTKPVNMTVEAAEKLCLSYNGTLCP